MATINYGYGGGTILENPAVDAALGVGIGAAQEFVTTSLDNQPSGAPWGTPILPALGSNGDLINFGTGAAAMALGIAGEANKGPLAVSKHKIGAHVAVGYGASLFTGWVTKLALKAAGVTGFSAASRRGYTPTVPTPVQAPHGNAGPAWTQRQVRVTNRVARASISTPITANNNKILGQFSS